MLDELSIIIPKKVWMVSMSETGADQLKLEGYVVDHNELSTFMRNLEKSPFFKDVILTIDCLEGGGSCGSSIKSGAPMQVYFFSISVRYRLALRSRQAIMEKYLQQFNQLPPVQRFGIFGGIAVVVVVLWYVLLYQDVISQQDGLKAKIVKANQELTEKKMMVSELNNFQREVERVQQQFQAALKELPDRQEIPALLQKLSRLARKAGLDIVSFEPKQEMIQEFYAEVPVKLALRGSYHDVANFYDEISKLPRIVSIKNIEFKAFIAKDASAAAAGLSAAAVVGCDL